MTFNQFMLKLNYSKMRAGLLIIPIIFLLSCSSNLHFYLRKGEGPHKVKKVAVLPFKNISDRREAGKIISNIFIQELFNSAMYSVEDMGNIRDFFVA